MRTIEVTGKNLDEALYTASKELNVGINEIVYEVIEENSKKGLFGLLGKSHIKIKVSVKEETKVIEKVEEEVKAVNVDKSSEEQPKVKVLLKEILKNMDVEADVEVNEDDEIIRVNVVGADVGAIIGYRGETLDALQYLLSLSINKNNGDGQHKKLILDAENYRHKREETLKRVADKTASKVIKSRRKYRLEPMNPYERRIIHSALQSNSKVCTYSEGEEPYRRVVVDLKK